MESTLTFAEQERIRAAEHRFCEAIDLKVNPETYDGRSCLDCIIGQLILAEHLADLDPHVIGYGQEFEGRGAFVDENGRRIPPNALPYLVADHFGVDADKVDIIFNNVARPELFEGDVATNLEDAKREVVAAYMDCYQEDNT